MLMLLIVRKEVDQEEHGGRNLRERDDEQVLNMK